VSRTFGECADGQMTAHGMRGNSETAFTPDTSQRRVFFFLAALLWRRRSVGEWPGRPFSYVIFSLCAWGGIRRRLWRHPQSVCKVLIRFDSRLTRVRRFSLFLFPSCSGSPQPSPSSVGLRHAVGDGPSPRRQTRQTCPRKPRLPSDRGLWLSLSFRTHADRVRVAGTIVQLP